MWEKSRTISTHRSARNTIEPMIIQRRPPLSRSMTGPISGAATANGANVSSR